MSKKQDAFYYNNFISCAEYSCKAVHLLKDILTDFNPEEISVKMDEMHDIEHQADDTKHEMTDKLAKAFITPIEREDIIELSHHIDDVTDKVEEVLIRVYINNVQEIPKEVMQLLDIVSKCCEEVWNLLKEFADFKHSKNLRDKIIAINTLEEEADALYIANMRKLHTEDHDMLHIIAWSEVYTYLEKCADACEHVADTVGSVVMKNS
ncbi:Putative pit accessory protein [Eubacteriaceae bacterium CHKCI004]|nr:Putative pit accessory protein [Eubacteriaceae bacterium CHKCI004]